MCCHDGAVFCCLVFFDVTGTNYGACKQSNAILSPDVIIECKKKVLRRYSPLVGNWCEKIAFETRRAQQSVRWSTTGTPHVPHQNNLKDLFF